MTSPKKRERGQGSIGNVPGSRFLYIWYYDTMRGSSTESPPEARFVRSRRRCSISASQPWAGESEDMRQILIDNYREKKIGKLVEEKQEDGTVKVYPYKRNLKVLDEFFAGMRLDQMDMDVFRAFRKKRRDEDIDDSTINRNLSILRSMVG